MYNPKTRHRTVRGMRLFSCTMRLFGKVPSGHVLCWYLIPAPIFGIKSGSSSILVHTHNLILIGIYISWICSTLRTGYKVGTEEYGRVLVPPTDQSMTYLLSLLINPR
jgi:hypothetical protein